MCYLTCQLEAEAVLCGIAQVAYVPQSAFIYNATVRENILFGQPYDEARYQTALNAASLAPDLAILPGVLSSQYGLPFRTQVPT